MLDRRLRRIADEIRLGVADEIDKIAAQGLPALEETGWAQLTMAFPSADNMLDEIQVHLKTCQGLRPCSKLDPPLETRNSRHGGVTAVYLVKRFCVPLSVLSWCGNVIFCAVAHAGGCADTCFVGRAASG